MMPNWTDIGGFWVSAGGFALAIILAIIGWVQADGAKEDAKIAKQQADAAQKQSKAAKRIADEAQRQTAAAESAAEAAKEQAEAAVAAVNWETVPQLAVLASKKQHRWVSDGRERRQVWTSEWYVVNNGKASANRLSVRLDFGSDTQVSLGPNQFAELASNDWQPLGLRGVVMPAFEDLIGAGYTPTAQLKYDTPTGLPKVETKVVLPYEQP